MLGVGTTDMITMLLLFNIAWRYTGRFRLYLYVVGSGGLKKIIDIGPRGVSF